MIVPLLLPIMFERFGLKWTTIFFSVCCVEG